MSNKLVKMALTSAWDAGGISGAILDGDLRATCALGGDHAGVAFGLAPDGAGIGLDSITHGVRGIYGQYVQIIESGVVVATGDTLFLGGIPVDIYRAAGVVTYEIPGFGPTYTSAVPSTGPVRLMASLFGPGDFVEVPALTDYEAPDTPEPPDGAQIDEVLTLSDSLLYSAFVYGWLSDGVQLTTTMAGDIELVGTLADWLVFVNEYSPQATYEAMLTNLLRIRDSASATNQELLQYATNLITGAVGRYAGFDFEGFTRVGMSTYGWKRDGLYRIEDGDDNGDPISAIVEFASEAFANQMKSRIVALFFGLSTDGQVFVRLIDDNDREVLYRAKRQQAEYRSNPYQGNQSKRWGLRLEIVDATEVVLDSVEWVVGSTNRRTTT